VVDEFEERVRGALDELPPDLAEKLENVAVVVEDEGPAGLRVLGQFESTPLLPRKITIYRRPLEQGYGHDPVELQRQIRVTVLHELAHYFGLDERRLAELGYG
jgi:predicted Zn-dependent protease with MMP-like domain